MKRLLSLLVYGILGSLQIFAYDFSAVSPSGHTLYYEYISKSDKTVRVTFELWNGTDAPYNTTPSGEITIPSTVTYEETTYSVIEIASYAFYACNKITSVTIQEGITIIMDDAFDECSKLQSVYLPNSLKTLKSWVFRACEKLKNIELPNSLSTIEASCFSGCKSLETITLPSSIKTIENYTFSNCENLTSITFPDGLLQIKEGAFHNCKKLSSITLPNSLTKIGKHAFDGIGEVVSISIPESVTEIGEEAFISYIEYFFFNSTIPPSISGAIFPDVAQIFVPCDAINNYLEHEDWEPYKERLKATLHKAAISYNIYPGSVSIKEVDGTACDNEYTLLLTASLKDYDTQYYQFGGWSDGNKDNPRTVTITKDTSFTALFGEKPRITNIQKNNPICTSATGSVSFDVEGGVAPYTVTWYGEDNTDNPRTGMTEGDYAFFVTDALGFTSDLQYEYLYSENNNMPVIETNTVLPICETATGEITPTITGGQEPYSYQWSEFSTKETTILAFEDEELPILVQTRIYDENYTSTLSYQISDGGALGTE
ncbi:MAG: leucine-rich repeat protein, partial [Bacteroidales bacterium]|nr:leucine-rich repeat protein [Bacteroidales bacterium]